MSSFTNCLTRCYPSEINRREPEHQAIKDKAQGKNGWLEIQVEKERFGAKISDFIKENRRIHEEPKIKIA